VPSGLGVSESGDHLIGNIEVAGVDLVHRRLDHGHVGLKPAQLDLFLRYLGRRNIGLSAGHRFFDDGRICHGGEGTVAGCPRR